MAVQSLTDFVRANADQTRDSGVFELESEHLLQINLSGMVWIRAGGMVAYRGEITFEREGMLSGGVGQFLKKAISGEGAQLTKASGRGQLYVADKGKRVNLIQLSGEPMFVNGDDVLAIDPSLQHEVTMMKKFAAMVSGGLFSVKLSGNGVVAVTTHHRPIALRVEPGKPVFTDPQATVAWSGGLAPSFKTDVQLKTLIGRGSGESFQMKFEGDGWVLIQPYEEDFVHED